MGKKSIKEDKNRYHLAREEQSLTREQVAEKLCIHTADGIEKNENKRIESQPFNVLAMSQGYKKTSLCNCCSYQCPIGKEYVPEVKIKGLSSIVIEMLVFLNFVNKTKERLIEIAADYIYLHSNPSKQTVLLEGLSKSFGSGVQLRKLALPQCGIICLRR